MKAKLSKDQVKQAMDSLRAAGKTPTLSAIHGSLGNCGSMTTLVKLKAEIDAEELLQKDSEEGIQVFRQFWALAVAEGRKQSEAEMAELRQSLEAISVEAQGMEGEVAATNERAKELERLRDGMAVEVAKANEQVTLARAAGEQHAQRLAGALERIEQLYIDHAAEIAKVSDQLTEARKVGEQRAQTLSGVLERTEGLQTSHAAEISQLRLQLTEAQTKAHQAELKLARIESKMEK